MKPTMSKRDQKRRKKLHNQLQENLREESKIKKQIDKIDEAEKVAEMKWMLGKCFHQKPDSGEYSGYFRVEYFRGSEPMGTKIYMYGRGKFKTFSLELNHYAFTDWLRDGKVIPKSRFNKYLKEAKSLIKYT